MLEDSSSSSGNPSITAVGEPALIRAASIEVAHGTVLAGRYQVEAVIGKGGSGIVLRAFDRVAQVPVAIKLLKPELAADPRWIERFSRELRLGRQMQHPNVCRIFDIGQADGHWFITMDLASGGTLRDVLGEAATMRPLEERLSDVRAVVAGLQAIHAAGIIHRDVKPDNFLRMDDRRLVLSDFGLATNPADAPTVSIMVGTPHYMAPEVVMGDVASARSDVWSAAVVIHEILVGTRPARTSVTSSPQTIVPPNAPKVLQQLLGACEVALANEPEDRPADGAALSLLIESRIDGKPAKRRPRGRIASWAWPAVAVAGAIAIGIASRHMWRGASASMSNIHAKPKAPTLRGAPEDWSAKASVIASFNDEHVHCVDWVEPDRRLRLILGSPRRAIDVDVATKETSPAALPPEMFKLGCPQRSRRGEVLFEAFDGRGRSQIMLARSETDASNAVALTQGSQPVWLPSGSEFVFTVDDSHAALFSVPVMSANIVSESADDTGLLVGKAVSSDGRSVALQYLDQSRQLHIVLHKLPSLSVVDRAMLDVTAGELAFSDSSDHLMFSMLSPGGRVLAELDLGSNNIAGLGSVAGRDLMMSRPGRDTWAMAARSLESDVWKQINGARAEQLTHDGHSFYADVSQRGDFVVEHMDPAGTFTIRFYEDGTVLRSTTDGPQDMTPSFLPDGSAWLYVDGRRRTIRKCLRTSSGCADVYASEDFPFLPVASSDGDQIAYITALEGQRLKVVDGGGVARDLGPARFACPPYWTADNHLWVLQGSDQNPFWSELDATTGEQVRTQTVSEPLRNVPRGCSLLSAPSGVLRPPRVASWTTENTQIRLRTR
jgi:serine/threonine protein kinase